MLASDKMKKIKNIALGFLLLTIIGPFYSCKKFLDIVPSTTSVNPVTVRDFQEILNNDSLSRGQFFPLDLMTDDVNMTDVAYNVGDNFYRRFFTWDTEIWNPAQLDFMYNGSYSRILQMNVILSRVENVVIDAQNTIEGRNSVISQALINRASYYLQLVNIYGPAYDPATATTDLGVPLVLTPDSYALPPRATVEAIYEQILADLRRAVSNPNLPAKGVDIIHPGKAAGYALLARAYLYRSDYPNAQLYADSALQQESRLMNLNTQTYVPAQLQDFSANPEILLGRMSTDGSYFNMYRSTFTIGPSLLDSLGGNFSTDRRFNTRFSYGRYGNGSYNSNLLDQAQMVFDASIGVPEMMLIRAECLARSGNAASAGAMINQIRANRFPPASLVNRTYTAGNILNYVLGERRRELCFKGGLRLFDLKRLNRVPATSKILIRTSANGTTLATLPVGSVRYRVPFARSILAANPNIVQNPR